MSFIADLDVASRPACFVALLAAVALVLAPRAGAAQRAELNPVPHTRDHVPGEVLQLDSLERQVLERNASYAAMRAAVRAARARVETEGALSDPMVRVYAAPRSFASGGPEPAWRAELELPLPWFDRRGARRAAAMAEADAAGAGLETARLDLIRETRTAFYDDYHFDQVRRTSLDLLDLLDHTRASALARYAAGLAPQQDVLDADVEIAMREHEVVSAQRSQTLVEARLRALLHLDPLTPLPAPPDTLERPDALDAVRLIARSNEARRPETLAAEADIRVAEARRALASRSNLFEPTIGFSYDRYWSEKELQPGVMAGLTLPIAPGRRSGAVHEAEAMLDAAKARRDAVRDELRRGIADASTEFEESLHELDIVAGRLLPAAERSLASARAGYASGRTDFSTLIRAAREVSNARLEYHRVLGDAHQARADLERALGQPAPVEGKESR